MAGKRRTFLETLTEREARTEPIPSDAHRKKSPFIDPNHVKELKSDAHSKARQTENTKFMNQKSVTPAQRIICFMTAFGADVQSIATATGHGERQVKSLIKRPEFQREIEKIQYRVFGKNPKHAFQEIMPSAIKTALEIMLDDSNKAGIRLNAAKDFMDRGAGKPVQRIEEEKTSLISILISQLDEKSKPIEAKQVGGDNNMNVIDYPGDEDEDIPDEVGIEKLPPALENPDKEPDIDLSSWVDENL